MEIIGLGEVITMMGSFAVVIALLAATLFGIKKYSAGMGFSGEQKLELLEIKNLGSRQKLLLVGINGDQVLIGVTPHSLTQLATWNTPGHAVKSQGGFDESKLTQKKGPHGMSFRTLFNKAKIKD
tara:strand:+ start:2095 stop:2469 length:375 start_codon:yes stop_codon:yes gene_type:complete